jgi:NADH-quinone oxidoreductase subunit C
MARRLEQLETLTREALQSAAVGLSVDRGELTVEVSPDSLLDSCFRLRDTEGLQFETLVDLCGVDYLAYGRSEWKTADATASGFSRSVNRSSDEVSPERRFAVVYHLLSVSLNHRIRLKVFAPAGEPPLVPSVMDIWPAANWYEREAFDLFGILFDGHPDLRRLLTDYGFIGHPFRKDFPLIGNVEVRYDPDKARVVYEPVSIEPRTLVPRVIRKDNRYEEALHRHGSDEAADG